MNSKVQALRIQKQLLDWLRCHGVRFSTLLTEQIIALHVVGRATIVLPTSDDEFLVSGAGGFRAFVEHIQDRYPGGGSFLGN